MAWIILAAVAALIAALLFIPASLHMHYDGSRTRVWVRLLFFRFLVSDSAKPPKEKKKSKEKSEKKPKKKKDLFEMLQFIIDIARSGLKAGKIIIKRLRFYGVKIHWVIARGDPYETGLAYGRANAVLYPVFGALANFFRVDFERIDVTPDFTAEKDSYDITVKARIMPLHIIRAGVSMLVDIIKGTYRRSAENNKKSKDGN